MTGRVFAVQPNNLRGFELPDNIRYNPVTGQLWRTWTNFSRLISGLDAGGYIRVSLYGHYHRAHRVIWFIVTGVWPTVAIDHINGDKADNRFINLREANKSENACNTGMRSDNTSGVKGVSWHKAASKWNARVEMSGICKSLGLFDDLQKAKAAVRRARVLVHGKYANHGGTA